MNTQALTLLSAVSGLSDQEAEEFGDLTVTDLRNAAAAIALPTDQTQPSQPTQSQAPATGSPMTARIRSAAGR